MSYFTVILLKVIKANHRFNFSYFFKYTTGNCCFNLSVIYNGKNIASMSLFFNLQRKNIALIS